MSFKTISLLVELGHIRPQLLPFLETEGLLMAHYPWHTWLQDRCFVRLEA